jgi:radical SAM protein with 4Fe4S-binding SPASM domain
MFSLPTRMAFKRGAAEGDRPFCTHGPQHQQAGFTCFKKRWRLMPYIPMGAARMNDAAFHVRHFDCLTRACRRQFRLRQFYMTSEGSPSVDMMITKQLKRMFVSRPSLFNFAKRVYWSRWLNSKSLFRKWVLSRAKAADNELPRTVPKVLIETMLTCNARCVMCVHSEKSMIGEMSMPLFEKVTRDVVELGVKHVGMFGYGEPLADRHWLDRIKVIRAHGLTYNFISNGSLLQPKTVEKMFDLGGWTNVKFSVNGFSPAVYEKVMPPLKREEVYKKLNTFLEMKHQKRNGSSPVVEISCVQLKENVHEIGEFLNYWQGRPGVDRVVLGNCEDWIGELSKDNLAQDGKKRGVDNGTWLAPCPEPWSTMVVYYDGTIAPCYADAGRRKLFIGDVNKASLKEIFHGPEAVALRKQHLCNKRGEHSTCGQCKLNYPWIKASGLD